MSLKKGKGCINIRRATGSAKTDESALCWRSAESEFTGWESDQVVNLFLLQELRHLIQPCQACRTSTSTLASTKVSRIVFIKTTMLMTDSLTLAFDDPWMPHAYIARGRSLLPYCVRLLFTDSHS